MQLEGSPIVEAANDRFDATMINIVTWNSANDSNRNCKQIKSDASIQVTHSNAMHALISTERQW